VRNDTRYALAALALLGALGLTAAQPSAPAGETPATDAAKLRRGGRQANAARLEALVTRYDDARARADEAALAGIEDDLKVMLSGGRQAAAAAGQPAGETAKTGATATTPDRSQEIKTEVGGLLGKMDAPSLGRKSELLHELLDLTRAEKAKAEPK